MLQADLRAANPPSRLITSCRFPRVLIRRSYICPRDPFSPPNFARFPLLELLPPGGDVVGGWVEWGCRVVIDKVRPQVKTKSPPPQAPNSVVLLLPFWGAWRLRRIDASSCPSRRGAVASGAPRRRRLPQPRAGRYFCSMCAHVACALCFRVSFSLWDTLNSTQLLVSLIASRNGAAPSHHVPCSCA